MKQFTKFAFVATICLCMTSCDRHYTYQNSQLGTIQVTVHSDGSRTETDPQGDSVKYDRNGKTVNIVPGDP
jgi:hypothetical protein